MGPSSNFQPIFPSFLKHRQQRLSVDVKAQGETAYLNTCFIIICCRCHWCPGEADDVMRDRAVCDQ